jgi:hypothetical protein
MTARHARPATHRSRSQHERLALSSATSLRALGL